MDGGRQILVGAFHSEAEGREGEGRGRPMRLVRLMVLPYRPRPERLRPEESLSEEAGPAGEPHSSSLFSLSALEMTETELKVMAALAITGLNSKPKKG